MKVLNKGIYFDAIETVLNVMLDIDERQGAILKLSFPVDKMMTLAYELKFNLHDRGCADE